jgi:Flp pilus assembly protein TadG
VIRSRLKVALGWLLRGRALDDKATTTVEFAIVGLMLCLMTFAILETGLLWWSKAEMQMTASNTARCGAVGYAYNTTNCVSSSTTQAWALSVANTWMFPGQITNSSITVNGKVTGGAGAANCNSAPGNYFSVTIAGNFFIHLPPPLGNYANLSATGCYPMQ